MNPNGSQKDGSENVEEANQKVGDGTSPKRLLATWANKQDAWLRAMVGEAISSGAAPSTDQVDRFFEMFLAEKRMSEAPVPEVPELDIVDGTGTQDDELEFVRLDNVEGVNALAPDQEIEFDSGLTILFGENGSGKTGYARIIKRMAGVRTAQPILSNTNVTGRQPEPSAKVAYRLGSVEDVLQWQNEMGVAPFTRVSVFDATVSQLHVDDELGYVFTPAELSFYARVSEGARAVQTRVSEEAGRSRPGTNVLLPLFQRGTEVFPLIESLSAATDVAELQRLAALPDDAETQQKQLLEEVSALSGGGIDARLATSRQRATNLERLRAFLGKVTSFDAIAYEVARQNLELADAERRRMREELFTATELAGPPDDKWQQFVAAADAYRKHVGLETYPHEGDQCLYCRQSLTSDALELVQKYRTFLDERVMQRQTQSAAQVDGLRLDVTDAAADAVTDIVDSLAGTENPPSWVAEAAGIVQDARVVSAETTRRGTCAVGDLAERSAKVLAIIVSEIDAAEATSESLAEQQRDRTSTLASKTKELAELTARIDLGKHLATATAHVKAAKRAAKLTQLGQQISYTVLRPLTDLAKIASEELANRDFERLFEEESKLLRAPRVVLEFQGRSGKAERKKVVARHRPSEVLSEGEQKALALADFLAESRMRGTRAPIVFDDPVTSLDYRRNNEVATRIAQLAESHQVVVFTHNIMFATKLIDLRQGKGTVRCKYYQVREKGDVKGFVSADVEPRRDTPNGIGKRINATIQSAKASKDPVSEDALVERGYGQLRSWCEAFVEQDLLGNVAQRYRANIVMGGLERIRLDRFPTAAHLAGEVFAKACRFMEGHSQPAEELNVRPTLADLEQDWKDLQEAQKAYLAP